MSVIPTTISSSSSSPTDTRVEKLKEPRRRRHQLSCAECRRLKLRCDRVFPCESCKKRGCAAICPDGALATKGTRFVLANTEEYHVKISDMSERIRALEVALGSLHSDIPHPLLRQDLLQIKVPVELNNRVASTTSSHRPKTTKESSRFDDNLPLQDGSLPVLLNASGTLKMRPNGRSIFFGQCANAEFFTKEWDIDTYEEGSSGLEALPLELHYISHAFPSGSNDRNAHLVQKILDFLPDSDELEKFVKIYYAHSAWLYQPCPKDLFQESLKHVLGNRYRPREIDLHRLALVFAVVAHGYLMDLEQKPYNPYSFQMYQLSRASLQLSPFLAEPSVSAIQALFLLGYYLVLANRKDAANAGWLVQCLNAKLAQALGLYRDLETWDEHSSKKEIQARRRSLWELITLEGWMSLGLGRPMTTRLSEVHCQIPDEIEESHQLLQGQAHLWHTWKHGFAPHICRVLEKTLSAKTPPYFDILELDHSIQAYNLPEDVIMQINGHEPPSPPPDKVPGMDLQRCIHIQAHSMALLLLHRGFFGKALDEKTDPLQSKYSPSVLATYNSALRVIFALQNAYAKHPALSRRFGMFWSNAFSASISLCLLVTCATRTSYASYAFQGLNIVHELFSTAASLECFPASIALPTINKLREKARAAFAAIDHGHPSALPYREKKQNDDEDEDDAELKALGGKTRIASLPDRPTRLNASNFHEPYPKSPIPMPINDHLEAVHPLLLEYVAHSRWSNGTTNSEVVRQRAQMYTGHPAQSYEPPQYNPSNRSMHEPSYAGINWNTHGHDTTNQSWTGSSSYISQENHYEGTYLQQDPESESNQYAAWQAHMQHLGLPL